MTVVWHLLALAALGTPALAQESRDSVWLAGKLDRDRVVIYFDAVKFGTSFPAGAIKIPSPAAYQFFSPRIVPAAAIAALHRPAGAHQFAIGDRYDLLLGSGRVLIVTLTAMVAYVGDEATGNSSYVGALAKVLPVDLSRFDGKYFAVRRHVAPMTPAAPGRNTHASLSSMPLTPSLEARIAPVIKTKFEADTDAAVRRAVRDGKITFTGVQTLYLANGSPRYYVRAKLESATICVNMEAWVSPVPTLNLAASEELPCSLPSAPLLNVVDLGPGRTGIIAAFVGQDSGSLALLEYKDGANFRHMRVLQTIWHAE